MGFVKIPDNLNEWAWFGDNNTLLVYIRLRFDAKYKDTAVGNVHLKRGQVIKTIPQIAEENGLTVQQTRTALNRLKATGKIAVKTTSKFSIITLIDYDPEDEDDSQNNRQTTDKQQTSNSPSLLTTNSKQANKQTLYARAREGVGLSETFVVFWNAYPKKTAKQQALKAWEKLNPDEELLSKILASLERQKQTVQWTKDNGQFIPYPASWLNGRRWEDDLTAIISVTGNTLSATTKTEESSFVVDDVMAELKQRYREDNSNDL